MLWVKKVNRVGRHGEHRGSHGQLLGAFGVIVDGQGVGECRISASSVSSDANKTVAWTLPWKRSRVPGSYSATGLLIVNREQREQRARRGAQRARPGGPYLCFGESAQ